ncbi:MAG: ATP synthase F1 subunit epsilon [Bacteroidales bacterium]|nr:ATP synthase F1 subunit epsilon [Bacteroidales bacterium]
MTLKIITPQREILSTEADLVELPGEMGRFEVLKDHAPLISSLSAGKIRYVRGGQEQEIQTQAGFVEVRNNVITVCIG